MKGVEYAGFPGWAADHPVSRSPLITVAALLLALAPGLAAGGVAGCTSVVDPFGYAERQVRHAVALTAVVTEDQSDGRGCRRAESLDSLPA